MNLIIIIAAVILLIYGAVKIISAAFVLSGNKAYNDGNNQKALDCYRKAAGMPLAGTSSKIMYALMLMRSGEFEKAENLLSEIILYGKTKPQEKFNARAYRCMAKQKLGKLDEATEDAEELFESCKNTVTYGMLGYLRQLRGGAELELCKEAYGYNSDDRDICDNLAVAYIRSGNLAEAEKLTEKLRSEYPDFAEAFYHSAQLALKKGDVSAAKAYADKIADCHFTAMTTVTQKDIEELKDEIKNA